MSAWKAREAGLSAAGIVDHDSVAGAEEMAFACGRFGLACTTGTEIRVLFTGTPLEGRRINNPSSLNSAYIVFHGIPRPSLRKVESFLKPLRKARNLRNRRLVEALNRKLGPLGIQPVDFVRDVLPLTEAKRGGAVTERHLLQAFGLRILARRTGDALVRFLSQDCGLILPLKQSASLADPENPHLIYDLIGLLKQGFLDGVFIHPGPDECPAVGKAVEFCRSVGAIPAYAYLGDVTESPTADKKAEKFEDDYLDELFPVLKQQGFQAVTYMPPRNTPEQLARVRAMCGRFELMEISGVDINSSRQSFNCPILLKPEFAPLIEATWALIAHERLSSRDRTKGLFHPSSGPEVVPLKDRIASYAAAVSGGR
jgi:hypothetical protein